MAERETMATDGHARRFLRCVLHTGLAELPQLCAICQRLDVERKIVERAVDALLAAGFVLNVNYGYGEIASSALKQASANRAEILIHTQQADDEFLMVRVDTGTRRINAGWVRFVYGNDGYDVIADYTTNLESVLKPVNDYADTFDPDTVRIGQTITLKREENGRQP